MNLEFAGWPFQDLQENVSNLRFVAWDTETTGVSPAADHIVEIAAVAFDEEFEHRRFDTLVKPPREIPADVIKIHGISNEMVATAPAPSEAFEKFFEFLGFAGVPRVLLAHNAGFDVGMLHALAATVRAQPDFTSPPPVSEICLDTCMLAKALLTEIPQHSMQALASHFHITTGTMHRAGEDVRVLHRVFMNLLGLAADRAATAGKGMTLESLIDLAGGYFVVSPNDSGVWRSPFRLPPRISALEPLCGSDARVAIMYEVEEDYRYITPITIRIKGFKVYVEALCHRENIKKTFRADKILRIGKVILAEDQPC